VPELGQVSKSLERLLEDETIRQDIVDKREVGEKRKQRKFLGGRERNSEPDRVI
jgi:hypothetical protein